jgi:hypothetical protein
MKCWAACLGDCGAKGSQEHTISECLYPDQLIIVQGFPWCLDAPKELPSKTLTQQILCKKHNEQLGSEVDWASKHSRDTLGEAMDLYTKRNSIRSRRWTIQYFETNMQLLERWCLKTLININHQSGWKYMDESQPESPPPELVEFVFGRRRFSDHKGLYVIAKVGSQQEMNDGRLRITPKTTREEPRLVGATFVLWGFPFYLNLLPEKIAWDGADLMRHEVKWWFQTGDDKSRNVKSHRLTFSYPTEQGYD